MSLYENSKKGLVYRVHNTYYHFKRFGFNGRTLRFVLRSRFGSGTEAVGFQPKGYAAPIHIRKNTSDTSVFDQVMLAREYDIPLPFTPRTIVDCGANIGLTTVYWKNRFPDAQIVCIEPETSNYELLVKNTVAYKDVTAVKAGLWPRSAYLTIENPDGANYGFRVMESEQETPDSIRAVTVGWIMEDFGFEGIDILKIDIEGSEKEVFSENHEAWLPKVKVLIVELHDRAKPGCAQAVLGALSKYRFNMEICGENLVFYMNPDE